MPLPQITVHDVQDLFVRKNFERILEFFRTESPLLGFKNFELSFTAAETRLFPHGLGFQPKDAWFTSKTGAGVPTLNYEQFTPELLSITVTGACVVRFFAGAYTSNL
jgi:hypothetical protein